MSPRFTNVIVRFDTEERLFTISFIDSNDPEICDRDFQVFKVIDVKLSDLMASGDLRAKQFIGDTVLSTINRLSDADNRILSKDEQVEQENIDHLNSLMEKRAKKGDAEAQQYIAVKYFNDSIEKKDVSLLDIAEEWYKKASENGSESADHFLRDYWPELKERYRQRIERDKE